jgi:hypothetical protein
LVLRIKQRAAENHIKRGIDSHLVQHFIKSETDIESIAKPIDIKCISHPALIQNIIINNSNEDDIQVYASGYKKDNLVGSGFCVFDGVNIIKQAKYKLASKCSMFQSELFSVLMAINFMYSHHKNQSFTIFCNPTVLNALKNTYSRAELVQKILEKNQLMTTNGKQIKFSAYQTQNERNALSKELAESGSTVHRKIDYDLIPLSHINKIILSNVNEEWNQIWSQSECGSTTREFIPNVEFRKGIQKYFSPNYEVTQMISNHGKFNKYLYKFNLTEQQNCRRCGLEPEDVNHLLFDCELLEEQRREFKKQMS